MDDVIENASDEFKEGVEYAKYVIGQKLIELILEHNFYIQGSYVTANRYLKEFIKSELSWFKQEKRRLPI